MTAAYTLSGETQLTLVSCEGNSENVRSEDSEGINQFEHTHAITGQTAGTVLYLELAEETDIAYSGYVWGTGGSFTICAFDPTSLDVPTVPNSLLSYYSNPVGNRLSIESPYDIQSLSVYDLVGREVISKTSQQQKLTLDTYALAPGAYLLRVETAEGQQTVKLVKK